MQPYPLWKICNIISQKWGGGGQRPFGIFPKNHPIWYPSLNSLHHCVQNPPLLWRRWSPLPRSIPHRPPGCWDLLYICLPLSSFACPRRFVAALLVFSFLHGLFAALPVSAVLSTFSARVGHRVNRWWYYQIWSSIFCIDFVCKESIWNIEWVWLKVL